ncbi:MAG: hypothetical protein WAW41_18660, partial [Methylobacter sp.]
GRLFFGYFLLAEQKKVTRLRGRDPDSNNRRASDTLYIIHSANCVTSVTKKNIKLRVSAIAPASPKAPTPTIHASRSW